MLSRYLLKTARPHYTPNQEVSLMIFFCGPASLTLEEVSVLLEEVSPQKRPILKVLGAKLVTYFFPGTCRKIVDQPLYMTYILHSMTWLKFH